MVSAQVVEELLDPTVLEEPLGQALISLSEGRSEAPPLTSVGSATGPLLSAPARVDGVGLGARVTTRRPDPLDGPRHQGLIALFDPESGAPVALVDAKAITTVRTALTARLAAGLLARPDARVLTIVGGGAQAVAQARAFAHLRPWAEVRAVNRSQPAAVRVAAEARAAGVGRASAVELTGRGGDGFRHSLVGAIADADVIALCTDADGPVIDPAAVPAGCHVSSVGSRAELPVELTHPGPVVAEWRGAVTEPPPAGAAELQHLDPSAVIELGELLQDPRRGRTDADQITVFKSTGHAVGDITAAAVVHRAALERGLGVVAPI